MAPHTVYFLSVPSPSEGAVISTLWAQDPKPVTVAKAHYFLSESRFSKTLASSPPTKSSPFNLVTIITGASTSLPSSVKDLTTQNSTPVEPLPPKPSSPPNPNEEPVEFPLTAELRTFLSTFSHENSGPVTMLNLVKVHDGMFPQYQKYMESFQEVLAPKYGISVGLVGQMLDEEENKGILFDMTGWIRYPGAANFGRMLDDEEYKDLGRKFKIGVVKDNPLLMIVDLKE